MNQLDHVYSIFPTISQQKLFSVATAASLIAYNNFVFVVMFFKDNIDHV